MGLNDTNRDAESSTKNENTAASRDTDAVVKNPNPRANENIGEDEKTAGGTVTGTEITDGEDA